MQGKDIRLLGRFAPATQTAIKHADLSPDSDSGRQYLTHLFTNKVMAHGHVLGHPLPALSFLLEIQVYLTILSLCRPLLVGGNGTES